MSLKDKAASGLLAPCVTQENVYDYCVAHGLVKKDKPKKITGLQDLIEEEELYLRTHIRRNTFGLWSYCPPSPTILEVSSNNEFDDSDNRDIPRDLYSSQHPFSRSPSPDDDPFAPEAALETWRQQLQQSFDGNETTNLPNHRSLSSDASALESDNGPPSYGDYSSIECTGFHNSTDRATRSPGPVDASSLAVPEAFYIWTPRDREKFLGIKAPKAPDGRYMCCGQNFEFKDFVEHRRSSDEHGNFGQGSRRRS